MNRLPRIGRIDFTSLQVRSEFMAIFNVNRAEWDFTQGSPNHSVFMLEILAVGSHFIRIVWRTKFYPTCTDLSCNPSFITGNMPATIQRSVSKENFDSSVRAVGERPSLRNHLRVTAQRSAPRGSKIAKRFMIGL